MSLLIDQLATWLENQHLGTVGTTIFKVHRPASPVACISLHPTGGYPPDGYTQREFPTVMIFARAATSGAALQKAYSIYNRLHGKQNVDLGGGISALTIQAVNSPAYMDIERAADQDAHLASFNLLFDLRRASS
jgi:hypothetical protein